MGLCAFDEEGTNENMIDNDLTEEEIDKSCGLREEIFAHVDLGSITTIVNIGDEYVTSKSNAAYYTEMYGWVFADINITEM